MSKKLAILPLIFLLVSLFSTIGLAIWWNSTSFPYSRPIINNITTEWTVSVNDTGLVKGKVLWALIKNESRLISSGADSTGEISIANETNQKFFEWENNLSGYSPTSLWTNNFVVYHFGEASGTQSADSTWSRNLTMTSGALGNTTGIYGNAFFSGGSGCGYTNASLDMSGTHEMTVTYWIKFWDTSSVYHGFIENENTANGFYMALPCDGANQCQGEFLFKSTSGTIYVSTGLPSTNLMDTWYFVACAYDRSASTSDTQLRCFINNTKYTTSGSMTPNTNSLANSVLYIGGRTCSGLFSTFLMDEFRIYKTSLTDAEILNIYNNGRNNLTRLGTEEQPAPTYFSYYANISSDQASNQNESITFYMSQISGFNRNQVSTNCSDIKIMNASDNQIMDYFIDICNSTDIRVGFLNNYNVAGVIAKIYWNSSTATAENKSMRIFYDDFEDGVFDDTGAGDWQKTTQCDNIITEAGGELGLSVTNLGANTACAIMWIKNTTTLQSETAYAKIKFASDAGSTGIGAGVINCTGSCNQGRMLVRRYDDSTKVALDNDNLVNGAGVSVSGLNKNIWWWGMIYQNGANTLGRAWVTTDNEPSSDTNTASYASRDGYFAMYPTSTPAYTQYYDDFQVWTVGYNPMMYATSSNLTLSSNATEEPYISITFNYSSVSFINMSSPSANNSAPNQLNGIYNVTVDTNANYKIEANGTNLVKGGDSIAISNLRIDTNSTKTDIAVGSSVSLSTSTQTIDNNIPSTNTVDYHGYWLTIPSKQPAGTYSTTVKITYSNV